MDPHLFRRFAGKDTDVGEFDEEECRKESNKRALRKETGDRCHVRTRRQRSPIPTKSTCLMRGTIHQGVLKHRNGEWLVPGMKFSRPMAVGRRSKLPHEGIRVLKCR